MRGDGPFPQRAITVLLHRLHAGHRELRPPPDHFVQGVAVERLVVASPGVGEPGGVDAAGERDVGVDVEQREARGDHPHRGMLVDQQ